MLFVDVRSDFPPSLPWRQIRSPAVWIVSVVLSSSFQVWPTNNLLTSSIPVANVPILKDRGIHIYGKTEHLQMEP